MHEKGYHCQKLVIRNTSVPLDRQQQQTLRHGQYNQNLCASVLRWMICNTITLENHNFGELQLITFCTVSLVWISQLVMLHMCNQWMEKTRWVRQEYDGKMLFMHLRPHQHQIVLEPSCSE